MRTALFRLWLLVSTPFVLLAILGIGVGRTARYTMYGLLGGLVEAAETANFYLTSVYVAFRKGGKF